MDLPGRLVVDEWTMLHNPKCSTCRNTLKLLNEKGVEPNLVEYLETPLDADKLGQLFDQLGDKSEQLVRTKESEWKDLPTKPQTKDEIVAFLASNPRALQRPVVIRGEQVVVARPPETVLTLL